MRDTPSPPPSPAASRQVGAPRFRGTAGEGARQFASPIAMGEAGAAREAGEPAEGALRPLPLGEGGGEGVVLLDSILQGRRSVRKYADRDVAEADLAAVLDAARWAPSPHNAEPWRFAVLRARETKEHLADAMAERWIADLSADGVAAEAIRREVAISRRRITGAPVVVVACLTGEGLDAYPDARRQRAEELMAAHSLGAAIQNVMLAAYARGLGTGWMCAPLFCPEIVVEALGLPRELRPQGLLMLGYPDAWPEARPRRAPADLVIRID